MAVPYQEGSAFAVPLRNGGYAIGIVARVTAKKYGKGVLLGYFFGPKHTLLPTREVSNSLNPRDALKVVSFGDLNLLNGKWPLIGRLDNWSRNDWPLPHFVRKDDISKRAWLVHYSDDNLLQPVKEVITSYDTTLERDSMFGAGAVELLLTRMLD